MNTYEWIDRLPLLLDSRDRGRKLLREFCHYLAGKADPDGTNVFPSIDTVSHWLHVTRRTTLGLYRQAEEEKLIIIEKRGHKVIKVRLNFDLPFEALDFPARVVADERRRKARERVARHRARKAEIGSDQCAPIPVTDLVSKVNEPAPIPVTTPREPAPIPVTTQATPLIDPQEDHPPLSTDAADASPAGLDVIEGEIVEEPRRLPAVPESSELAEPQPPMIENLSSAWLLPEELPKGRKPAAAAQLYAAGDFPIPAAAHTPTEWVKLLTDRWSAACIERHRSNPSGPMFGQAGKAIRALVHAGNNPNHILVAAVEAGGKGSAAVDKFMSSARPSQSWTSARPGSKQLVTSQGVVRLPEGITNNQRRALSIRASFAAHAQRHQAS